MNISSHILAAVVLLAGAVIYGTDALCAMADVYEQQFGCGAPGIPAQPLPGHDATAEARG